MLPSRGSNTSKASSEHVRADFGANQEPAGEPAQQARTDPGEEAVDVTQRIYVGNLPYSSSEDELRELFAQYGEVVSCALPIDRETGRPRGFGFVEMSDEDGRKAIEALDGQPFGGRQLRVNESVASFFVLFHVARASRMTLPRARGGNFGVKFFFPPVRLYEIFQKENT